MARRNGVGPAGRRLIAAALFAAAVQLCGSPGSLAAEDEDSSAQSAPAIAAALSAIAGATPEHLARAFPGDVRFGPPGGDPPAIPVFRGKEAAGFVFATRQVTGSTGYSGKPLDLMVGIETSGRITGVAIVEHHEPILVIGVTEARLGSFVAQYTGIDIRAPVRLSGVAPSRDREAGAPDAVGIDGIAGASISSVVFNDAILRSARIIARSRGILPQLAAQGAAGAPEVDFDTFAPETWDGLVADGAVARLALTIGQVNEALVREGGTARTPVTDAEGVEGDSAATFIDLYAALATPARIGRNLFGDRDFNRIMSALAPRAQVLFLAGNGLYSFKGTAFARTGTFDRIALVQGNSTIRLATTGYTRLDAVAAKGAPDFREAALFTLPPETGFNPAEPWRLQLLVGAPGEEEERGEHARDGRFVTFELPYRLPDSLLRRPPAAAAAADEEMAGPVRQLPLWQEVWRGHPVKIAVLSLALIVLTVALVFQDWIERRPQFYRNFRTSFLIFTLLWIGWYAEAQLSVFNVITFVQAVMTGFRWDFFLLGPLMFILWSFVAITLMFWGRGVFCGWLCPFGALQELLNTVARRIGIPQLRIKFMIQERLWMVKYVLFLSLLGVSFYSVDLAVVGSEVEPFKTAISLKFVREWPFVVYAASLLVAGLFVERFYCRYLCALGAALAVPARLRMFEWLKRRPQCGTECHICAVQCTVGAIHPDGHINLNECIYCLNCQIVYYNDHVCPPLIARRKRRQIRAQLGNWQQRPSAGEVEAAAKGSEG